MDKPIEVNRLIRAKYQDNLEFLQRVRGVRRRVSTWDSTLGFESVS